MSKGNQTVNWKVGTDLDPESLGRAIWNVLPAGFYHGSDPSVDDVDTLKVPSFEAIIRDDDNSVSAFISTDENVYIDAEESSPYFIVGWQLNGTDDNYAYFDHKKEADIEDYELKIGKGEFDANGDLTGIKLDVPDYRDEQLVGHINTRTVLSEKFQLEDIDEDGNRWEIKENSDGELIATHPDLNSPYVLKQSGGLFLPDVSDNGKEWSFKENSNDNLEISHPDLSKAIIIGTDGQIKEVSDPDDPQDVATQNWVNENTSNTGFDGLVLLDNPITVESRTSGVEDTINVTNYGDIANDAVALFIYGFANEFGGNKNPVTIELRHSGQSYKEFVKAQGDLDLGDSADNVSNTAWWPLDSGKIEYDITIPDGSVRLEIHGYV